VEHPPELHVSDGYGELVTDALKERAKAKGAECARDAWQEILGSDEGEQLYKAIVENGPLLPEWIVMRIGDERIRDAAKVLLEVDILSMGEWTEIEALRTCHAGLVVLLTLAEAAMEEQPQERSQGPDEPASRGVGE
jgi:hypothetical protein